MAIFTKQFYIFNGQIETRAFRIFQNQTFMRRPRCRHQVKPVIAADTMIDMHHQITRR